MSYLKNDNFAIISLKVECPRGSDEAVCLAHYIIPKSSDQCEGVQQVNPRHHCLQLIIKQNKQNDAIYNISHSELSLCAVMRQGRRQEGFS